MDYVFADIVGNKWVQHTSEEIPRLGAAQPRIRVVPSTAEQTAALLLAASEN